MCIQIAMFVILYTSLKIAAFSEKLQSYRTWILSSFMFIWIKSPYLCARSCLWPQKTHALCNMGKSERRVTRTETEMTLGFLSLQNQSKECFKYFMDIKKGLLLCLLPSLREIIPILCIFLWDAETERKIGKIPVAFLQTIPVCPAYTNEAILLVFSTLQAFLSQAVQDMPTFARVFAL